MMFSAAAGYSSEGGRYVYTFKSEKGVWGDEL